MEVRIAFLFVASIQQKQGRVDKFIVKSRILPTNCSIFATVSIRGIIKDHTAPRNKSPRTVAEHQLRLVIKCKANIHRL